MTDNTATALPALPEPWSASSTIRCVACGAPYVPRPYPTAAAANPFIGAQPIAPYACKCGSTSWQGTLGEGLSPAQYTADQMRAYGEQCASAVRASAGAVEVPAGWTERVVKLVDFIAHLARIDNDEAIPQAMLDLRKLLAAAPSALTARPSVALTDPLVQQMAEALEKIGAMYVHTWDKEDGGLAMFGNSVDQFEEAHSLVSAALRAYKERGIPSAPSAQQQAGGE